MDDLIEVARTGENELTWIYAMNSSGVGALMVSALRRTSTKSRLKADIATVDDEDLCIVPHARVLGYLRKRLGPDLHSFSIEHAQKQYLWL